MHVKAGRAFQAKILGILEGGLGAPTNLMGGKDLYREGNHQSRSARPPMKLIIGEWFNRRESNACRDLEFYGRYRWI